MDKVQKDRLFKKSIKRATKKAMFRQASTKCIFCKIVEKTESADVSFENDEIMIFKDIKPAAKHHYLSIPKQHIENVNSLSTSDHKELLERLLYEGKRVLQERGGDVNDVLLGFHVPPFNTVGHLHLHVISPASTLSLLYRVMFKPNTWWFASVEEVQEKLDKLIGNESQLNNKL